MVAYASTAVMATKDYWLRLLVWFGWEETLEGGKYSKAEGMFCRWVMERAAFAVPGYVRNEEGEA